MAALFSKPKPQGKIAHAPAHGHGHHGHGHAASSDAIPSDIDGFLAWMDQDAGNLDKALATI